jgi:hypothetical protein
MSLLVKKRKQHKKFQWDKVSKNQPEKPLSKEWKTVDG